MRAEIRLIEDDGSVAKVIEVPDATADLRWAAPPGEHLWIGTTRLIIGVGYKVFIERVDLRSNEEIEESNRSGGFGLQRQAAHEAAMAEEAKPDRGVVPRKKR
jgi:hypothetical protein